MSSDGARRIGWRSDLGSAVSVRFILLTFPHIFAKFTHSTDHVDADGVHLLIFDKEIGVRPVAYQQDFSQIIPPMTGVESANSSTNSSPYVSTSNSTFANVWQCGSYIESNESVCGPNCGPCAQPAANKSLVDVCRPMQTNVDFVGQDLAAYRSSDPEECCDICKAVKGCTAFTWSNFESGTCWLKSQVVEVKTTTGVKSAVMTRQCTTLLLGYDLVGTDIGSASSSKPEDCCSLCNARIGCKSFTWSSYNNGTCWLKSGDGGQRSPSAAVVSGIL